MSSKPSSSSSCPLAGRKPEPGLALTPLPFLEAFLGLKPTTSLAFLAITALPGEAPTSLFSFFLAARAWPWRLSLLALAFSSAVTGLGPSEPKDEDGDGVGAGLPGGGGGGGGAMRPSLDGVSLVVTRPDLVV